MYWFHCVLMYIKEERRRLASLAKSIRVPDSMQDAFKKLIKYIRSLFLMQMTICRKEDVFQRLDIRAREQLERVVGRLNYIETERRHQLEAVLDANPYVVHGTQTALTNPVSDSYAGWRPQSEEKPLTPFWRSSMSPPRDRKKVFY